jgi:hypothetical protein
MMIVFVVPPKSSQTFKSWEYTSKLFERCMRSLCNQTSPAFRVVVVCQHHINHNQAVEMMALRGTPLEPLPFAGSVYISPANKDSIFANRSFLRRLRENPKMIFSPVKKIFIEMTNSQPLTDYIRQEFSLE